MMNPELTSLIAALQDKNENLRQKAAKALGALADPSAVAPLIAALKDDSWEVRYWAVYSLGTIGDARAVGPLIAALKDKAVREDIPFALESIGECAVAPLIATLQDEDENVRWGAVIALGSIGEFAVEPLIATLNNKSKDVRCLAASAMGMIFNTSVVPPLIGLLKDESWEVRRVAVDALGNLGDPCVVVPLINVLQDDDEAVDVRCRAAYSLGNLWDPRAVPPLIDALQYELEIVGGIPNNEDDFAVTALGTIRKPQNIRCWAAEALGKLRDIRAIEPLQKALKAETQTVAREVMKRALADDKSWGYYHDKTLAEPSSSFLICKLNPKNEEETGWRLVEVQSKGLSVSTEFLHDEDSFWVNLKLPEPVEVSFFFRDSDGLLNSHSFSEVQPLLTEKGGEIVLKIDGDAAFDGIYDYTCDGSLQQETRARSRIGGNHFTQFAGVVGFNSEVDPTKRHIAITAVAWDDATEAARRINMARVGLGDYDKAQNHFEEELDDVTHLLISY
ncbi:MAG: HEAT repeat domain-containing protein [Candidatus Heimdallarchaeota archaeon]